MTIENTDGPTVDCRIVEEDGRLIVQWPEGRGPIKVSPEVVESWAAQVNELRAENARLRGEFDRKRNGRWPTAVRVPQGEEG